MNLLFLCLTIIFITQIKAGNILSNREGAQSSQDSNGENSPILPVSDTNLTIEEILEFFHQLNLGDDDEDEETTEESHDGQTEHEDSSSNTNESDHNEFHQQLNATHPVAEDGQATEENSDNPIQQEGIQQNMTSSHDLSSSSTNAQNNNENNNAIAECPICLEPLENPAEVQQLHACQHQFHRSCVNRWLVHIFHTTCPVCRAEVASEDLPSARQYPRFAFVVVGPNVTPGNSYLVDNRGNNVEEGNEQHIFLFSAENMMEHLFNTNSIIATDQHSRLVYIIPVSPGNTPPGSP